MHACTRRKQLSVFDHGYKLMLTSLSAHMFLYCFYLWPYILNVQTSSHETPDIFSITVHLFHDLFRKICLLFGQTLMKYLKCSWFFYCNPPIVKIHAGDEFASTSEFSSQEFKVKTHFFKFICKKICCRSQKL